MIFIFIIRGSPWIIITRRISFRRATVFRRRSWSRRTRWWWNWRTTRTRFSFITLIIITLTFFRWKLIIWAWIWFRTSSEIWSSVFNSDKGRLLDESSFCCSQSSCCFSATALRISSYRSACFTAKSKLSIWWWFFISFNDSPGQTLFNLLT